MVVHLAVFMDLTPFFVGGLIGVVIGIVLTQLFYKLIDKKALHYRNVEAGKVHRHKTDKIRAEFALALAEGSKMLSEGVSWDKIVPELLAKYPELPVDAIGYFDKKRKRPEPERKIGLFEKIFFSGLPDLPDDSNKND